MQPEPTPDIPPATDGVAGMHGRRGRVGGRMSGFRWLLVLLGPAVGLALAAAGAIVLVRLLEGLCPPALMVSGVCTASWFPAAEKAALALASFCGAGVFVGVPAFAAPAFKPAVAWTAFGAGLAVAGIFLWHGGADLLPSFAAALAGGLLGVVLGRGKGPRAA